jgi:hypothetical protein
MPQPGQQTNNLSYWQRMENAQWWMMYPALTVMVFLRRDMGYRLLKPQHIFTVNGILLAISVLIRPPNAQAGPEALLGFALLSFILGSGQRGKRWKEMKAGVVQHSYYIGTSPFDYRWLPDWCRRDRRMARFVDPLVCGLIGLACWPVSIMLCYWLMFAAVCLRGYEDAVHRKELNRDMDMIDSLLISQAHEKTVEQFEDSPAPQPQQTTIGVPTGLAPDIQQHIERRKSK